MMRHKINLFCIPFAGGSIYSYRVFSKHLPDFINLQSIDLPGHGTRIKEPLLTDIHDMVDDIYNSLNDKLEQPYAIYGHSLGAMIAYLSTIKLSLDNKPIPKHLVVSGCGGPPAKRKEIVHHLPKQEFFAKLKEYGGTPKEVLQEQELLDFFEPVLRADFQALETYQYKNAPLLNVPITALIGIDERITYDDVLKWEQVTADNVYVQEFTGGHFFIFDHIKEITQIISNALIEK